MTRSVRQDDPRGEELYEVPWDQKIKHLLSRARVEGVVVASLMFLVASKFYGVNATIMIFLFVLYCIHHCNYCSFCFYFLYSKFCVFCHCFYGLFVVFVVFVFFAVLLFLLLCHLKRLRMACRCSVAIVPLTRGCPT